MLRPFSISASGNGISWSTGAYQYDGSGNIKAIGSDVYAYDTAGRILQGTAYSVGNAFQRYAFDSYGNLLTTETWLSGSLSESRSTPTDPATNHMQGNGATYDAAGNLSTWQGWTYGGQTYTYTFDSLNNLTTLVGNGSPTYQKDWTYFYDADDERIWSYNHITHRSRYRLRGLDSAKALREYTRDGWDLSNPFGPQGTWTWLEDWIWRDGNLLAGVNATQTFFFHLDHLGTPRVVSTLGAAGAYDTRAYYPFGEEATAQDSGSWDFMKYTAHERDVMSFERNSFDYMHARHYDAIMGRFLSVDRHRGHPEAPQTWNRYSYAWNSPLNLVDPDGREPLSPTMIAALQNIYGGNPGGVQVFRFPWLTPDTRAMTLGNVILLSPSDWENYKAGNLEGVKTIAHEYRHVRQYRNLDLGPYMPNLFPAAYMAATWASGNVFYSSSSYFEHPAYLMEGDIVRVDAELTVHATSEPSSYRIDPQYFTVNPFDAGSIRGWGGLFDAWLNGAISIDGIRY